jgi:hypothetical protein
MDVNQDIVRYVESTGKVLKQAEELAGQLVREEKKIAEVAPKVASLLVGQGLIRKGENEMATKKLASHEGALEVVQNLIAELGQTKRAYEQKIASSGSGHPVDPRSVELTATQKASVNVMGGGVIGQRAGSGQKKAADWAYENILLGNN